MKKLLSIAALLGFMVGIIMIVIGSFGIVFIYNNISKENIVTPSDASIPNTRVTGIRTLKSQADVIRKHTLDSTNGKTFAEMPRQIEKLDEQGNTIKGEDGKPIMVPNTARDMWITATTLITALHFGIVTYAFSILIVIVGFMSLITGYVFSKMKQL